MAKVQLTAQRIARASCPSGQAQALIWDAVQPGLALRVYPTGRKVFVAFYRAGGGRNAQQRWLTIGDAYAIALKDAREAARAKLGEVAKGSDPSGERKADRKRERALLGAALDAYEASLVGRRVVKRGEVLSLLRRELLQPLGNVDLAELDRQTLAGRVAEVERSGRPGGARELKTRATVFLGWCVGEGLLLANPLAGWRRPRTTKAERQERPGRALADAELPAFWTATAGAGWPFGQYLQLLLLCGQRRTETALMRWEDLDLDTGVWSLPAEVTKSGRAHRVPLPAEVVGILRTLPRLAGSPYVFPGRRGGPMAGWSKRLPAIYRKAGLAPWTPHDLRRTFRSGLAALGVDHATAELMLNHVIGDELAQAYDREPRWQQRTEAASRWAQHVLGIVRGEQRKVVPLRRRGRA